MQKRMNNLKFINMKYFTTVLIFLTVFTLQAQDKDAQGRIKIDGVAAVIGKNIVLNSDIDKYKKEFEAQAQKKIEISNCEIIEELMIQKLIAHHAVIDSIEVSDAEVNGDVENKINYFTQQVGSMESVLELYGFDDEEDLRNELFKITKESMLIRREKASIVENIDVTPEEVRAYYKSLEVANQLPEFPSEVELAQIVLHLEPSEAEVERVISKLNEIKKEIEDGYSFKLKAMINSDDPAVSHQGPGSGGKYTITRQSGFIKEFKEVAFSLEEGEISDPFKSDFGYHILQVNKIKGQERDVSHILITPKNTEAEIEAANTKLQSIREQVLNNEITFEEAVVKYSDDKETKNNKGLIINPNTNDTRFDLTRMQPELYNRVANLKEGEITMPFFEDNRGEKSHKIILLKSKTETHTADFTKDYEKIQELALQKKQEEVIEKWVNTKIADTYVKLNKEFKDCNFKNNWNKN